MVTDLPDYEKKVVVVTIPGDYPAEMKIDHVKVKGLGLKDPYVALCVPSSIENPAIAYDSVNDRFYVEVAKISATDPVTVEQAEKDRTVTGTLTQSTKHDAQTFLSARIDTATATTNIEVVAAQGEGKKIYVVGYQLQAKGDVEAVLRSASTDLSPEWDFNAREGVIAPPCVWPEFYFVTAANEALNIYLDAAVRVTGNVQYVVAT